MSNAIVFNKVVVLGGGGVGKSTLTVQFVQNIFVDQYDPTIEDQYRKQLVVDDETTLIEVFDTIGTDYYTLDNAIGAGQAFLILYAITSRESFDQVTTFMEQVKRIKDTDRPLAFLVANKSDLADSQEVSTEEGRELAAVLNVPFIEVSAKTRLNVDTLFREAIRAIRREMRATVGASKMMHRSSGRCDLL